MAHTEERPPSLVEGEVEGGSSSPLLEKKEERSGSDGAGQEGEGGKVEREEVVAESGEQVEKEPAKEDVTEGAEKEERLEEEEEEEAIEYKSHRRKHGATSGTSSEEEEEEEEEEWHSTEQGDEQPRVKAELVEEDDLDNDGQAEEKEEEKEEEEEEEEESGGWEEREPPLGAEDRQEEEEEEEEKEEEKLPKNNPMFVPRGKYFHHDDRECDEEEGMQPSQKVPSRSEVVDKWEHDLYIPEEQAPRTPQEKEKDQRYYDNMERRRKEQQKYGDRGEGRGRRGVQLGHYLPQEQRGRLQQGRRREARWGEKERGGEGRRSWGSYGDGGESRVQKVGDRRGQEKRRDREMERRGGRGEQGKTEKGERSRESPAAVIPSTELWDDDLPITESSELTNRPRDSPPAQFKAQRSLFKQDSSAPMPTRLFTLGRRRELIVKDLPSSGRSEANLRKPVGRGRGRGRGGGRSTYQPSPGGAASSTGVKVIAPFAEHAYSTTPPSQSNKSHPVLQSSSSQPATPTTPPSPIFQQESEPDVGKSVTTPSPDKDTSSSQDQEHTPTHRRDSNPDKKSPQQQTSILGSPPVATETVKPKRYSSRRLKGTGAPLTAIPTKEQEIGVQDGPPSMMLAAPWVTHPHMVPLDQAYQQQAMFAAMMQNPMMAQMLLYQQQQIQMMHGYPPHPQAAPAAGGPILDQYLEHSGSPQVAAGFPPSQPPPPPLPPPQDADKHPSPEAPGGLFIPGIDPEQQRLMQAQRGIGLAQKPNQAIPIVPPKEK